MRGTGKSLSKGQKGGLLSQIPEQMAKIEALGQRTETSLKQGQCEGCQCSDGGSK